MFQMIAEVKEENTSSFRVTLSKEFERGSKLSSNLKEENVGCGESHEIIRQSLNNISRDSTDKD